MRDPDLVGPIPPEAHVPALVAALGDTAGTVLEKLTARQRRFVEEYLVDMNASAAAKRAGYSLKSAAWIGYENLRKPDIVDAIAAVMSKRSKRTGIDRSWVLANLADVHEKAKNKDTAAHMAHRLKALELIGKHVDVRAFRLGFGFGDDGNGDPSAPIWDLSQLTDEEFDTFERLLVKVTVTRPSSGAPDRAGEAEGPEAPSGASGGDSGDL